MSSFSSRGFSELNVNNKVVDRQGWELKSQNGITMNMNIRHNNNKFSIRNVELSDVAKLMGGPLPAENESYETDSKQHTLKLSEPYTSISKSTRKHKPNSKSNIQTKPKSLRKTKSLRKPKSLRKTKSIRKTKSVRKPKSIRKTKPSSKSVQFIGVNDSSQRTNTIY